MPNWCYTEINISHDDESKVAELERLLKEWTGKNYEENGFGTGWLGNVVIGSGIWKDDGYRKAWEKVRCRGSISMFYRHDNKLTVCTETAWVPMLEMWEAIVERYLDGGSISYIAEEGGCELYYTNDIEYVGKYYFDNYGIDGVETEQFADEAYMVSLLQNLTGAEDEEDIDRLIFKFEGMEISEQASIHKWQYVPLTELN